MKSPSPIVQISCIKHVYPDKATVSICGLDFVVNEGERVAVLGPSGSGKTTLFRHVLGLLRPMEGTVRVFGLDPSREFAKIRTLIGFVFQNVDEQFTQPTVFDEIAFGPRNFGYKKEEAWKMTEEIIARFHIEDLKNRLPQYLSGGQKRMVALASALVLKPKLLILDEPFEGLDLATRKEFITFLLELWTKEHFAMTFSLHDVNLVPSLADTVYLMRPGGEISARGKPEEVFADEEKLKSFRLEQPILQKIFHEFQAYHPELKSTAPKTIEEALTLLKTLNPKP